MGSWYVMYALRTMKCYRLFNSLFDAYIRETMEKKVCVRLTTSYGTSYGRVERSCVNVAVHFVWRARITQITERIWYLTLIIASCFFLCTADVSCSHSLSRCLSAGVSDAWKCSELISHWPKHILYDTGLNVNTRRTPYFACLPACASGFSLYFFMFFVRCAPHSSIFASLFSLSCFIHGSPLFGRINACENRNTWGTLYGHAWHQWLDGVK